MQMISKLLKPGLLALLLYPSAFVFAEVTLKYATLAPENTVWAKTIKKCVDEMLSSHLLLFEQFIGLTSLPGPSGLVENTHEGIICRVNRRVYAIENKTYSWQNGFITFHDDFKINNNRGYYAHVSECEIEAYFGGEKHTLRFNKDYRQFISTRKRDLEIVIGNVQTI
jgi:hypothetical protein